MIQQLLAAYGASAPAFSAVALDFEVGGTTAAGATSFGLTAYSDTPGYGWQGGVPDAGQNNGLNGGTTDGDWFKDEVYSAATKTFRVKVTPGGSVGARWYCFDTRFPAPSASFGTVRVTADGGGSVDISTPTVGAYGELTGTDSNNDGYIDFTIAYLSGGAITGYWISNGVQLAATVGSLPAVRT